MHKNARLTPHGRERIVWQVESGQTAEAIAEVVGVCTVAWLTIAEYRSSLFLERDISPLARCYIDKRYNYAIDDVVDGATRPDTHDEGCVSLQVNEA
jgi:hypothetical protein